METAELKALLAKAKKEEIAFAFGRGKTPEDSELVLDKKKKPVALFKALKAAGNIKAGSWGMVEVDGTLARFMPAKALSGLERDLKALFKREKISIKVEVSEGGSEDESED
jgi:hypothetical protein